MSAVLSGENHCQLYVPPGFAHGFCVTSETAHVQYKCTELYEKDDEIAMLWNDPRDRHRLADRGAAPEPP